MAYSSQPGIGGQGWAGVFVTTTGRPWVGLTTFVGVDTPGSKVCTMDGNVFVGSIVGTLKAMPSVIATRIAPMMMTVEAMADRNPRETSLKLFMQRQARAHSLD